MYVSSTATRYPRLWRTGSSVSRIRERSEIPIEGSSSGSGEAAVGHSLDEVPIRQAISDIPTHAQLDNVSVEWLIAGNRVSDDRLRHSALHKGPFILPDTP